MPLRRKTRRSSGRSTEDGEDGNLSPTSNGGRTHPKEMYAPDRATRSRTSSEDLIILELPKNNRKNVKNQAKPGRPNKDDAKSRKVDKLSSTNSKQINNVNSSGPSPHLNDGTPGVSGRTRRRSGRVSVDGTEKEARKISPQTAVQSVARSARRRKRSGNDAELDLSPVGPENKSVKSDGSRHRGRRLSSMDDRSPVGKSDHAKETKKSSTHSKKLEQDGDHGNFKVPLISNKLKSDSSDVAIHDSSRASSRRHTPGKSATIDTVLSVDVDVTSQDSLSTRTSPRRPKVSPRLVDKKSVKDGDKISPVTNAASRDTPPVSPRTRSTAVLKQSNEQEEDISATSDSSRKRRASGNQDAEAAVAHSSKKKRKTGSVCRDLVTEFEERGKSSYPESIPNSDAGDNNIARDDDSVSGKPDEQEGTDNSSTVQDEDGVASPGAKSHRSGKTTPTNSPRKSMARSPCRSPSRRGLRSSGQIPDAPSESTEESEEANNLIGNKESVTDESLEERTPFVEDATETEDTNENRTEDNQGDIYKECDMEDGKPIVEELDDFTGEAWYEDVEDTELFYFETDHVALKGNRDYRMMLRTLTTLEAQRKQAVEDLDLLVDKKKDAMQNPLGFAQKLQQREDVGLPNPQRVVVLPEIEWTKYLGAADAIEIAGFKHQTRGAKSSSSKSSSSAAVKNSNTSNINILAAVSQLSQKPTSGTQSSSQGHQQHQQLQHQQLISPVSFQQPSTSSTPDVIFSTFDRREPFVVRGRSGDPNKPASFNQLWTVDEQRTLEELLVKFPMEEVEARRWEKVARALGNRTAQQVASRVQKYFIKLTKAGLPVPGRIPNMTYYTNRKRGETRKVHPFTKSLYQPSTFLQSVRPPVYMNEEDEHIGWSGYVPGQDDDDDDDLISDDESIPVELRNCEEYHELLRLKKMKKDKQKQQSLMSHQGYKCDGCNMEPIVGIRWHCIDCPTHLSTDLCQACVDCDFSSPEHFSSHHMEPIQYHYSGGAGPSFVDTDYTTFTPITGDYNYLDPNYNPSALPT